MAKESFHLVSVLILAAALIVSFFNRAHPAISSLKFISYTYIHGRCANLVFFSFARLLAFFFLQNERCSPDVIMNAGCCPMLGEAKVRMRGQ